MNGSKLLRLLSMVGLVAALLLVAGCDDDDNALNPADENEARLIISMSDAPPPQGVEEINVTIEAVEAFEQDHGWFTLNEPDTTINFLDLVNGATIEIADDSVPSGAYTELRFTLAETNSIVITGEEHDLVVPSDAQSDMRVEVNFVLNEGDTREVFVDFNLSSSLELVGATYELRPTFNAFMFEDAVLVSGMVKDFLGNPVMSASVEATDTGYETSTITNVNGHYSLILPPGSYLLEAMAEGYDDVDTTYQSVMVDDSDSTLTGFDFELLINTP